MLNRSSDSRDSFCTLALRFAENFAPKNGTIAAHEEAIESKGFVWYGKLGAAISGKTEKMLLDDSRPHFLLIHSGGKERYWVFFDKIQRDTPPLEEIPEYYRNIANKFGCWFRVSKFVLAPKDVLAHCFVVSSGSPLSEASRRSMSPYFVVKCENGYFTSE